MTGPITCHFILETSGDDITKTIPLAGTDTVLSTIRTIFFNDSISTARLISEYVVLANGIEICDECTAQAVVDMCGDAISTNDVEEIARSIVDSRSGVDLTVISEMDSVTDVQANTSSRNASVGIDSISTPVSNRNTQTDTTSRHTPMSNRNTQTGTTSRHTPVSNRNTQTGTGRNADINFLFSLPHPVTLTLRIRTRSKGTCTLPEHIKGLANLGNTCYMNSALQCLINLPLLTEHIRQNTFRGTLTSAYRRLLNEYHSSAVVVVPAEFKRVLGECFRKFSGSREEDASDFLLSVLARMSEEIVAEHNTTSGDTANCNNCNINDNNTDMNNNTITDMNNNDMNNVSIGGMADSKPIAMVDDDRLCRHRKEFMAFKAKHTDIFTTLLFSWLSSLLTCTACGHTKERGEPFLSLELPIPDETSYHPLVVLTFKQKRELMDGRLVLRNRTADAERMAVKSIKLFVKSSCTVRDMKERIASKYRIACLVAINRAYRILRDDEMVAGSKEIFVYEYEQDRQYVFVRLSIVSFVFYRTELDVPLMCEQRMCESGMVEEVYGEITSYCDGKERMRAVDGRACKEETTSCCDGKERREMGHGCKEGTTNCCDRQGKRREMGHECKEETTSCCDGKKGREIGHTRNDETTNCCDGRERMRTCNDEKCGKCKERREMGRETGSTSESVLAISRLDTTTGTRTGSAVSVDASAQDTHVYDHIRIDRYTHGMAQFGTVTAVVKESRLLRMVDSYNLRKKFYSEKKRVHTLRDCLSLFLSKEYLGVENSLFCTRCARVSVHTKKYEILFLPKYLIIHLKRFNNYQKKVCTYVDYHALLVISGVRYRLRSTCHHIEIGMGSGHYIAYLYGDRVISVNDSVVSSVKDVNKKNAYILFYERV